MKSSRTLAPAVTTATSSWYFRTWRGKPEFINVMEGAPDEHVERGCAKKACPDKCPFRDSRWRTYTAARVDVLDLADRRVVLTLDPRDPRCNGGGDFTSGPVVSIDETAIPKMRVSA